MLKNNKLYKNQAMSNLVIIQNEKALTTSMLVADAFDKQHSHVIRDINNLDCSKEFHESNFRLMFIDKKIGNDAVRQDPSYTITRDGFVFLAMGYRGKKAAKFKEAYINAFNEMERQIRERQLPSSQELLVKINEQRAHCKATILEYRDKLKKLDGMAEILSGEILNLNQPKPDLTAQALSEVPNYHPRSDWTYKVINLKVGETCMIPSRHCATIRRSMQSIRMKGQVFKVKMTTRDTPIGQAKVWRIK